MSLERHQKNKPEKEDGPGPVRGVSHKNDPSFWLSVSYMDLFSYTLISLSVFQTDLKNKQASQPTTKKIVVQSVHSERTCSSIRILVLLLALYL